jgi:hypothetical protein
MASLSKKGFVGTDGAAGDDACCWITEAGLAALNEQKGG